jgi:hypothetical protein
MLVETVEQPDVDLESWEFCDGKKGLGGGRDHLWLTGAS